MGRSGLGELETIVLATVHRLGDEVTGTVAYEDLTERAGRDPTVPAVHVTLRRLESKGLLRSRLGGVSPRGGRRQRLFSLTPEGRAALAESRAMWARVFDGLGLADAPESGS